eukprot:TRINITY_DN3637_c0_g1_i1.p1 TRINITY_DN3637_c0_g1~~TRINITY_DN3637_c0_g1_i1.p1  ORF type:complete len:849 (+),score=219.09 TRINITY_DN3637_c0_g1_i1:168-2549(+)
MDDSTFRLIAEFLRSKHLDKTADLLWCERDDAKKRDSDDSIDSVEEATVAQELRRVLRTKDDAPLSVAVPFSGGRKMNSQLEGLDMLAGEDIEYQGEEKSLKNLQQKQDEMFRMDELDRQDGEPDDEEEFKVGSSESHSERQIQRAKSDLDGIASAKTQLFRKSASASSLHSPNAERKLQTIHFSNEVETTEVETDVYLDADEVEDHENREDFGDAATSRTSSILRSRTGSTSSARSSIKSVSFATSDEEDEEDDNSSDEWSDDDDPGYVKVPIEALDYFHNSEDDLDIDDDDDETEENGAAEDDNDPTYKFKSLEFEENENEQADNENDEWEQPATQDESAQATQDTIGGIGMTSGIQSYGLNPSVSLSSLNESFTQEELEVEKLNQILRKHIQSQKDEYYQEWNSADAPVGVPPAKIELKTSLDQSELLARQQAPQSDFKDEFPPQQAILYESFNLPIICETGRTGLQESKDFPIEMNSIIAGRYQILEFLGSAAFSKAIRCHDLTTSLQVCVKIIKNNKEFLDQSLDEIRLLQYINSAGNADEKNVLQLYDYFYHKEHLFIVTELLRDNLYEFYKYNLESGDELYFTLDRLKRVAKQCLVALEFVHSLNLIHCDLKPENILIKSYSRTEVKIIDFGSSCFTKDHLSSYVQSRSYRAPEVILGFPYNSKIDLWSLGCIIAELWTGKVLFHNESISTLLARVVSILGPFDGEMLKGSRYAHKYFTKTCSLYETKPGQSGFTFLKPKRTTLKARLKTENEEFLDFVSKLLAKNPNDRLSAKEALEHPFLKDVS